MAELPRFATMDRVTADKQAVITKMRANRDAHEIAYNNAVEGYLERIKDVSFRLNRSIQAAETIGEFTGPDAINLSELAQLPRPQSYLEFYDEAIDALEADSNQTVVLTRAEFNQYWRDKWEWAQQFFRSTSMYTKI